MAAEDLDNVDVIRLNIEKLFLSSKENDKKRNLIISVARLLTKR
jgi:hypothetical protein